MNIREVALEDALGVSQIYNHYIQTSHSTFEVEPVSAPEMEDRIHDLADLAYPFFVAELDDRIVGYAYGHQFRTRAAYCHSIEVSVYVRDGIGGTGIGSALYEVLIPTVFDNNNVHTAIAGISLPNDTSVRLHEKFGFEKVAHFVEVGLKFGRWIDVGYWQLLRK